MSAAPESKLLQQFETALQQIQNAPFVPASEMFRGVHEVKLPLSQHPALLETLEKAEQLEHGEMRPALPGETIFWEHMPPSQEDILQHRKKIETFDWRLRVGFHEQWVKAAKEGRMVLWKCRKKASGAPGGSSVTLPPMEGDALLASSQRPQDSAFYRWLDDRRNQTLMGDEVPQNAFVQVDELYRKIVTSCLGLRRIWEENDEYLQRGLYGEKHLQLLASTIVAMRAELLHEWRRGGPLVKRARRKRPLPAAEAAEAAEAGGAARARAKVTEGGGEPPRIVVAEPPAPPPPEPAPPPPEPAAAAAPEPAAEGALFEQSRQIAQILAPGAEVASTDPRASALYHAVAIIVVMIRTLYDHYDDKEAFLTAFSMLMTTSAKDAYFDDITGGTLTDYERWKELGIVPKRDTDPLQPLLDVKYSPNDLALKCHTLLVRSEPPGAIVAAILLKRCCFLLWRLGASTATIRELLRDMPEIHKHMPIFVSREQVNLQVFCGMISTQPAAGEQEKAPEDLRIVIAAGEEGARVARGAEWAREVAQGADALAKVVCGEGEEK